jgi:hypothetical protein
MRDDALGASRILIEVAAQATFRAAALFTGGTVLFCRFGAWWVGPIAGPAPASVASLPPQATALYASPKVDAAAAMGMPRAVLICRSMPHVSGLGDHWPTAANVTSGP